RLVEKILVDGDFERDFSEQSGARRGLLRRKSALLFPALLPIAQRIADGHSLDANLVQGFLHRLELCRLNEGEDQAHPYRIMGARPDRYDGETEGIRLLS